MARHRRRARCASTAPASSAGPAHRHRDPCARCSSRRAATSGPGSARTAASCTTRAQGAGQLRLERRIRNGRRAGRRRRARLAVDRRRNDLGRSPRRAVPLLRRSMVEVDGRRARARRGPRAAWSMPMGGSWSGPARRARLDDAPTHDAFALDEAGPARRDPVLGISVDASGAIWRTDGVHGFKARASAGAARSPAPRSAAGSASCTTARATCGWAPEGRACGA